MKTLIPLFACLLCCPLAAGASTIGIYITETPAQIEDTVLIAPQGGLYTVYLVCAEPENDDGDAISTLGGFECELSVSGGWTFSSVVLPPNVLDFDSATEAFYCSGTMPVSSGFATLATISLLNYTPTKGWVWIAPYSAPSRPGELVITDADNGFELASVEPSSGDYEQPIFGINQGAEKEDATWSGVKATFQ